MSTTKYPVGVKTHHHSDEFMTKTGGIVVRMTVYGVAGGIRNVPCATNLAVARLEQLRARGELN